MHYPRTQATRDRRSVDIRGRGDPFMLPALPHQRRALVHRVQPGRDHHRANDRHWNGYDLRGSEHQQPVGARIQPRLLGWFFSRLAGSTGQIRGRAMPGASEVRRGSKAAPMLGGFGWRAVAGRRDGSRFPCRRGAGSQVLAGLARASAAHARATRPRRPLGGAVGRQRGPACAASRPVPTRSRCRTGRTCYVRS
jgi:hypothetical protein